MSTYVVAEAGVNHNGSLDQALRLVDAAADAGANAVKFQTFQADQLVSSRSPKADYQRETTDEDESQLRMLRKLELEREHHHEIKNHAESQGIEFLSTPYDAASLNFIVDELDVPYVKIASADITNASLLWHAARTHVPLILSTGMSHIGEVEDALSVLAHGYVSDDAPESLEECREVYSASDGEDALRDNVHLLHCTSEYPASPDMVHLRAMDTLHDAFGLPIGYSDHTKGIEVPVAAVARGATVIEKHYTLDRTLPGPDHRASLEPDELRSMVNAVRCVERALGMSRKCPRDIEWENRRPMRRSLVADQDIAEGEVITEEKLAIKRPDEGISAIHFWDQCGKKAQRDYESGELILP